MSATDELVAAAKELAAELRAHYMLPNTWPTSQRFLRAVEALPANGQEQNDSQEPAGGRQDQSAPPGASRGPSPSAPLAPEKPEAGRRAPQT